MSKRDTVLTVTGMSCGSCVRHVTSALIELPGVAKVEVSLKAGTVLVRHEPEASTGSMVKALKDAGYDAELATVPVTSSAAASLPK